MRNKKEPGIREIKNILSEIEKNGSFSFRNYYYNVVKH